LDIIQPYLSSTLSKIGKTLCLYNTPTAQLSAHHCCVCQIPQIITHCSPYSIVENLHSSRTE
ncbi:hypothetical protein M9458_000600, partial [Cirrhinus mrigala]